MRGLLVGGINENPLPNTADGSELTRTKKATPAKVR